MVPILHHFPEVCTCTLLAMDLKTLVGGIFHFPLLLTPMQESAHFERRVENWGVFKTGPLSTSALRPALLKPNGCFTQQHYVQVPNLWLSSLHSENSLIHLDQIRMKRFSGTFVYLLASSCESAHEPKAVPQNCVLRHMQICAPRHGSPSAVCASC